ncbi:hypothetical protein EC968_002471 [Mortierella alpina]|nr:hypothetical protein EC968_002471 [Mortierella alpina]
MTPREECGSIPELIDHIVTFLDHSTLLSCLRVNSTWNKAATPYAARSSTMLLLSPFSLIPKKLPKCEKTQEAFKRNLEHLEALIVSDHMAIELFSGADKLANVTTLYYLRSKQADEEVTHLSKIIQKNPNLKNIHFFTSPFEISGNRRRDREPLYDLFDYPWTEPVEEPVRLDPFERHILEVTELATALQTLALTQLTLEFCLDLDVVDMKTVLDSVLKPSLKRLQLKVNFKGHSGGISHQLQTAFYNDVSSNVSSNASNELEATVLGLEGLHIDPMVRGSLQSARTNTLFRPIVFPIIRRSPKLKELFVTALDQSSVPELKAILQETCPLLERLELAPNPHGPDERACTELILGCPQVTKVEHSGRQAWDFTEFAPGILRHQDACLRLTELNLNTRQHENASGWIQRLLCSLPNLTVFSQELDGEELALLNVCDMVQSRWVCTRLQKLRFAVGSICRLSNEEEEGGRTEAEAVEQRKCMIRQAYEQLGALTQLKTLVLCYKVFEQSPVQLDMTFDTGLRAMEPCLSSLKQIEISRVENIRLGRQELRWMMRLGLERDYIMLCREYCQTVPGLGSDDEFEDDEEDEDYEEDKDFEEDEYHEEDLADETGEIGEDDASVGRTEGRP